MGEPILEADRIFAEQSAAFPLPAGVGEQTASIIAIRIPGWRDGALATLQAAAIRDWLHKMGLKPEETANITTAKAWGGLYDMWVAENPGVAQPSNQVPAPAVADGDDQTAPADGQEPADEQQTSPEPVAEPEPVAIDRRPLPPRQFTRPAPPRQVEAPRRLPPPRRPVQEREVGPFGF
jgi:hypothetical protein